MTDYKELWIKKRQLVKNLHTFNADWEFTIVKIFKERIDEFYLNPINQLIHKGKGNGEGFSVVAIECLLIETFAAFRYGKCYKYTANSGHYYSNSSGMFTDFLRNKAISIFEINFWTNDGSNPIGDANKFYSEVRCGILHEAQTKDNWTVNTTKGAKNKKNFLCNKDGKIQIYRTTLYYKLEEYLKEYCDELKQNNGEGEQLRKNLGRKLDNLFEIPEDITYNWWN